MSQTLLYNAKIQENFLKAVRFYEKAPVFLILSMQIKPSVFNELDHVRIVGFSKKDFIDTFKTPDTSASVYDTKDLLKFSTIKNQNPLIDFYTKNFGEGFYNSYRNNNKSPESGGCIIDIDKSDIYYDKSNLYSLFITVKDTYILLEKENKSVENSVYFKVYVKDKSKNVIWSSSVITSPTKINDLITDTNINNEFKYLKYFIKNDLQSAVLSITNTTGQKFLKINFPSGVANESINNITGRRLSRNSKNDIVGLFGTYYDNSLDSKIVDQSKDILIDLSCTYNDINLTEKFSSTYVKTSSLYDFDRQFVQFSLSNVYEKIIDDYYKNKNSFVFSLSLNVSSGNKLNYTVPNHTITLNRTSSVIQEILSNFNPIFIESKKSYLEGISVSYKNVNTRMVQHKIDISNVKDKLSQIKLINLKDNFRNKNTIYLSLGENTESNVLQIDSIENMLDLKNISLEVEDGDKIVFYTITLDDEISNNEKFVYTFKYFIGNNFESSHDVIGKQTYNVDLDKINYKNKTLETNKLFKKSLNIDINKTNFNLNLSSNNPMIFNINEFKLNNIDRFSGLSRFYGYDSVKEFLSACLVRFSYTSKVSKNNVSFRQDESYLRSGTVGFFEKFYNFDEIFRVNDNNEITSNDNIISNLSFQEDLKNSSFNNLIQLKRSGIFDFIFDDINPKYLTYKFHKLNNPQSTIILSYDMMLYPVPSLLNKYKNKGLDNIKNVINYFNNEQETEMVDALFYDFIYNDNMQVSFSSYLKIKESFFDSNVNLNEFYKFLTKNMYDIRNLPPLDVSKLNNTTFNALILTERELENNSIYNTTKAENYVERMFKSSLRVQGFPFTSNNIVKSDDNSNMNTIIYTLPDILKFDFDIVKAIKKINNLNGASNVGQRFINILNDSGTSFESRFALTPMLKLSNDDSILSNEEINQIKASSFYIDVVNEGNNTLMKPNAEFYSIVEEYQTWSNFTFDYYENYGEDSYSLTLTTPDQMLSHVNYKNYFTEFFNEASYFGFTKLHDIRLNVALLITTPDIINLTGKNDFWCDYYQTSLLVNETIDYDIGSLNTIRFVQKV